MSVQIMQRLRDLESVRAIPQVEWREFILNRIEQICDGAVYVSGVHGEFVLVEAADNVNVIEVATGCKFVTNICDGSRLGDGGITPCFEWVAEHLTCYEMPFVLSDDGYGLVFIIPKQSGMDAELMNLCAAYAEPVLDCVTIAIP
jgi:hypothetical protein